MRGDRLKQLRVQKKLSQLELAKILGVDRTMIGKYELKNNQPKKDILEKMADFFNVEPSYLMGFDTAVRNTKNVMPDLVPSDEHELIKKYRQLNTDGKERINRQIDFELYQLNRKAEEGVANCG